MIKQRLLSLILFALFCSTLSAQSTTPRTRKTILQVWEEIFVSQGEEYIINNVDIVFTAEDNNALRERFNQPHTIKPWVSFGDVFSTNIQLINEVKDFEEIDPAMNMSNLTFDKGIAFWRIPKLQYIYFTQCTFNGSVTVIPAQDQNFNLEIWECQLNKRFYIDCGRSKSAFVFLKQTNCNIKFKEAMRSSVIRGNDQTNLVIEKVQFTNSNPDKSWISFENNFSSIEIDSCDFGEDLAVNNVNVTKNFSISNSTFRNISLSDMLLPPSQGVAVNWQQISKKLCVLNSANV